MTIVLTYAVLSAALQLYSMSRTGILPRCSRHQMSLELCMCSFWKRRLTFCFLKSCGLTRLVCLPSGVWCLDFSFWKMTLKTIFKMHAHLWQTGASTCVLLKYVLLHAVSLICSASESPGEWGERYPTHTIFCWKIGKT